MCAEIADEIGVVLLGGDLQGGFVGDGHGFQERGYGGKLAVAVLEIIVHEGVELLEKLAGEFVGAGPANAVGQVDHQAEDDGQDGDGEEELDERISARVAASRENAER